MRYRKKPVEVEAIQYTGENHTEIEEFMGVSGLADAHPYAVFISTLEGQMRASVGYWIIKGVAGEFYPCKPDIFEQTYEAVKE